MKRSTLLPTRKTREEALDDIRGKMTGVMRGMTMIVGFYIRGPFGAPVSNPALEITSSAYVSHSAEILYRNAYGVFDRAVDQQGHVYVNIHSQGLNRPRGSPQRPSLHGPELADHIQRQLYLRRQHPAHEKGEPPVFGGPRRFTKTALWSWPSICSSPVSRGRGGG